MKTIAAIAIILAALVVPARADPADWRTIATEDGVSYLLNVGSIERKFDHTGAPYQAVILVYRDTGGPLDDRGYHIVGFDCRGRYMLFDDVRDIHQIKYGSIISRVEDIACWGPK